VDDEPATDEPARCGGGEVDRVRVGRVPDTPHLERGGVAQRGPAAAVPDRGHEPRVPVDGPGIGVHAGKQADELAGPHRVFHDMRRYGRERFGSGQDARAGGQPIVQICVHVATMS
jgi:hypothetical protein